MNELTIFNSAEFGTVRTLNTDGKIWFVAKDVCEVLGYTNFSKALSDHIDGDDKLNNESLSSLGQRGGWLINESGLYSLVLRSKLPSAKKFKKWVTNEVLPSIRKHGGYIAGQEEMSSEELLCRAVLFANSKITELQDKLVFANKQLDNAQATIKEQEPKIEFHDAVLRHNGLITTSIIAKAYGYSARAFNELLHTHKVQYKQNGVWVLYSPYEKYGYATYDTVDYDKQDGTQGVKQILKWTQRGRKWLYETLKKRKILPIIEQSDLFDDGVAVGVSLS